MLIDNAITIRLLAKRKTTQLTQVIKDPNMGKVDTWTDLSTAIILHFTFIFACSRFYLWTDKDSSLQCCMDISGFEGLNTGWDQTVTCYIACVAIVLPGPCL